MPIHPTLPHGTIIQFPCLPDAIRMAPPMAAQRSDCDAAAIESECAYLSHRIACGHVTLELMLDTLASIVGAFGGHAGSDVDAHGERAAWAVAQVVSRFNRYLQSAWSTGHTRPTRTTVSANGSNALIISHPSMTPIRIDAHDGVIVITHGRVRECLPLMSGLAFSLAVRRIWISSWRAQCGISTIHQDLLRGLQPGSFGNSSGVRDPWLEDQLWLWWRDTLKAGPAQALAVQERLSSCGGRIPAVWLRGPSGRRLWDFPMVVKDIMAYPAAAIAAARIDDLLDIPSFDQGRVAMSAWMDLFAPEDPVSRHVNRTAGIALRRTLVNLSTGVFPSAVVALRALQIDRPVTGHLVFMSHVIPVTSWCEQCRAHVGVPRSANQDCLERTSEVEWMAITRVAAEANIMPAGALSVDGLDALYRYLLTYPYRHQGTAWGLLEHSRSWFQRRERERAKHPEHGAGGLPEDLGPPPQDEPRGDVTHAHHDVHSRDAMIASGALDHVPMAVPAWELPPVPGLTFLSTVGELRAEGRRMHHRVGDTVFIANARAGWCHFFHVDHDGERATVDMAPDGAINDIQGPNSRRNRACVWARRQLSLWRRSRSRPDGHDYAHGPEPRETRGRSPAPPPQRGLGQPRPETAAEDLRQ